VNDGVAEHALPLLLIGEQILRWASSRSAEKGAASHPRSRFASLRWQSDGRDGVMAGCRQVSVRLAGGEQRRLCRGLDRAVSLG
jgi:hypothetical protein